MCVCVLLYVCGTTGGKDGRQGCKGGEVARVGRGTEEVLSRKIETYVVENGNELSSLQWVKWMK